MNSDLDLNLEKLNDIDGKYNKQPSSNRLISLNKILPTRDS